MYVCVRRMNETCRTHERVMSHTWKRRATCRTYEQAVSRKYFLYTWGFCRISRRDISCMRTSHVSPTHELEMSHVCKGRVTHTKTSYRTQGWIMSRTHERGTGWRRVIGCLIFIFHSPQKSPGRAATERFSAQLLCAHWIGPEVCGCVESVLCLFDRGHQCHGDFRFRLLLHPLSFMCVTSQCVASHMANNADVFLDVSKKLSYRSFFAKEPLISGSFVKNNLQLKAFYGSSPPCTLHTQMTSQHTDECVL